jgi:hypothetical protein
MTEVNSVEQHVRPQRLGMAVGQILLWGVEQRARVDDMVLENASKNPYWKVGAERDDLSLSDWVLNERARQNTKLEWRRLDAKKLLSLDMIMHIRDQQGYIISSGSLQGIKLRSASIVMADLPWGITSDITFAEQLPLPEDLQHGKLQQSYFGHQLKVNFEVISIPPGNVELLQ